MMRSKVMTAMLSKSTGSKSRRRRYAVVSLPGMAIVAVFQVRQGRPRSRHDERAAAPAERAAGTEQRILFAQMAQGVIGDLGEVEPALERQAVQRLHVLEPFPELDARDVDLAVDEGVEDERVVRAGRIAYGERLCHPSRVPSVQDSENGLLDRF